MIYFTPLCVYISRYEDLLSLHSRSSNKGLMLHAPNTITKKTLGDSAYMCAAPKLWNSLPCHVCNKMDFSKFKILLKTHLKFSFYLGSDCAGF